MVKLGSRGPFTVTASEDKYTNPWISVREDKVVRPGGGAGIFGIVTMKPGATILVVDENNMVYMTHEYKYAYGQDSFELVSGGLDDGEDFATGARRELAEELGIVGVTEWVDLGVLHPFTTVIDSPNAMFMARGPFQFSERNLDPGEIIDIEKVPFDQAVAYAMNGRVVHAASVVCLLKAALLRG